MRDTITNSVGTLYALYHKDIVRFFADHLAERDSAWDMCHEVFVRLLLTLASGTQIRHPRHWLMRVAKNLLIDTYRQRHATQTTLSALQEQTLLSSDAPSFWTLLERRDLLHLIAETFSALPEQYQRLLLWRDIERLPLQELMLRTGTNEAVLSTQLWRARKMLQKEYLRQRLGDLLPADEEIFEHLDSLIKFHVATEPEDQLQQLQTHVRNYFETIAPTWDEYVASAYEANLQQHLTRLLPWRRDMQVLDAGTGTGYLAGMLAPLVGEVIGVDNSPAMLTCAGEKMAQAGYQQVSLRDGRAEQLPLEDASVDVATCHMLLHHVISPRSVLSELRRVVRPGGYIVIIDAHKHGHHWTPQAFGDLHYGTDLKQLRKHLSALHIKTLQVEGAGISYSGVSIGNDATFSNFLLVGQVSEHR